MVSVPVGEWRRKRGTYVAFVVGCGALLAGCDHCASWRADVEALRVFETLDAEAMAKQAIGRGDLSVLAVSAGNKDHVPGIPDEKCALTRMRNRSIDPTPDIHCSPEHHRLKRTAVVYAERYNTVIREFRQSKGLPSCEA
jgi:hypothetical protein